jgi:integrase
MPRRAKPPRLYLDPDRRTWIIRDGSSSVRTGCAEGQIREAEAKLHEYLGAKHRPEAKGNPLIADALIVYHDERLAHTKSLHSNLTVWRDAAKWWGDKHVSDINPSNSRAYVESKGAAVQMARRGLEMLRAALNYWHKSSYGPLDRVPPIPLPPKSQPRRRWLNEDEFARLLEAARFEHLSRFLLLGWLTGSRPGVILSLEWDWIDLEAGIMHRRAPGTAEDAKKKTPPIRIGQELLAYLRAWHEVDGPARKYVVHWNGKNLTDIKDAWRSAIAKAGLDDKVIRHTLRHSRATRRMRMGKDPWAIAGHLGMSLETLERVYGHHHPDFQKDVADA